METSPCLGCLERDARIAALEARVAELESRLQDLAKPPTPPRAIRALPKAPAKKPTGRKPGGQPGHPPHLKQLLPPERINEIVPFVPSHCQHCQKPLPQTLGADDPPPTRHQVVELPQVTACVTEYQGHARTCPCCGTITRAIIPAEIRAHSVGPKLTGAFSYLVGCQGVSKRGVEEIAEVLLDAPVSLGTVANLEQEMSEALAPAHQEALDAVQQAPVKNVDETGWKQAGHKRWLWVAATVNVVAFLIHTLRNATALRQLLGATLSGIVCSDRWCVYDEVPILRRQVCWAHLKRNWEKMLEWGGSAAKIARACLSVQERVFEIWHLYRGGGCSWSKMDDEMAPLMLSLLEILRQGERGRDRKTQRFCARLLKVFPGLWTFVSTEGVEPTNNHAERVQRRAVLWRRRSFGCHSAEGCRFAERILTVVETLRLQHRSVLPFLHQAITAHRNAQTEPKLLLG